MKKVVVLFLLLSYTMHSFAVPTEVLNWWNDANRAYQKQQYEHAIDNYERIISSKHVDADVYYNLANTYYKNEDKGKAVLNYLRALDLNPNYQKAKDNITFIQKQQSNPFAAEQDFWVTKLLNTIKNWLSPNAWAWLAAIAIIATSVLFLLKQKHRLQFANRWMLMSAGLGLLFFIIALFSQTTSSMVDKAVVMQADAFLFDSDKKTKVKWNLPEGTIVNIEKQGKAKELYAVELSNGVKGWIDAGDVEKVLLKLQ